MLHNDSLACKQLATHSSFDYCLATDSVFANGCQEMSSKQVVYLPLLNFKLLLISVLHGMDGGMCFVIQLSISGTRPHLSRGHSPSEFSVFGILAETVYNRPQVNSRIEFSSFCSWVAQKTFVVQFFHYLHCLLWRNAQLFAYQLLRIDRIKRLRSVLESLLLNHTGNSCKHRFLTLFVKNKAN